MSNHPPLQDQLDLATEDFRARAKDLAAQASRCEITDSITAGKAVALAGLIKTLLNEIDEARERFKKPMLEDGRTIDRAFGEVADILAERVKGKVFGGPLQSVLDRLQAAEAMVPAKGAYGFSATRRAAIEARVVDFPVALAWAFDQDPAWLKAAVEEIVSRAVRRGVRQIPGTLIKEATHIGVRAT